MTRHVTHLFWTIGEARAFRDGVAWVNDSGIEFVRVEFVREGAIAVFTDQDETDGDEEVDHR